MAIPQQFSRLRLPVIGSPMFIVSGLDLVEAQCRAGILGTFPALNARPGGATSPFALLPEVRKFFDGTIILAGAIGDGASVLAAQAMGADMVYMGTRFIATREANAPDAYKQMIVDSGSKDVTYTNMFSGVHGNYLSKSMIAAGLDPANLPVPETGRTYVAGHKREKPQAWRDIWGAGQGSGAITDIPSVAELVDRMAAEYRAAAVRVAGLVA